MGELHLAIGVPVPDVCPTSLRVVQRRAAVGLAIRSERGHPHLDIMHADFAGAHVARRALDDLVGKFQALYDVGGDLEEPIMPVPRRRRVVLANDVLLHLEELVHPQQATDVAAGATGFAPEARRYSSI